MVIEDSKRSSGGWLMRFAVILVPLVAVSMVASAADSDALAARRLYYQDNAPEVVFKATTVAPKAAQTPPKPKFTGGDGSEVGRGA